MIRIIPLAYGITYNTPKDGHVFPRPGLDNVERNTIGRLAVQTHFKVVVNDGGVVGGGPGVAAAGSVEEGVASDDDLGDRET